MKNIEQQIKDWERIGKLIEKVKQTFPQSHEESLMKELYQKIKEYKVTYGDKYDPKERPK